MNKVIALDKSSVFQKKPYFTFYIEASYCLGNLSINKFGIIPLSNSNIKLEIPVNDFIRPGQNELMLWLQTKSEKTFDPKKSECKVTMRVRPIDGNPTHNIDIASLIYSGKMAAVGDGIMTNSSSGKLNSNKVFAYDDKGDVVVTKVLLEDDKYNEKKVIVTRNIVLPNISMPAWAFFDSDDLTAMDGNDIWGRMSDAEHDKLRKELFPYYQKIWTALYNKNPKSIISLFEERNRETDLGAHRRIGYSEEVLLDLFEKAVNDSDQDLDPVKVDDLWVNVYDNKKLVRLEQKNNLPFIQFKIKDTTLIESFDIVYRKQNGKWIISR